MNSNKKILIIAVVLTALMLLVWITGFLTEYKNEGIDSDNSDSKKAPLTSPDYVSSGIESEDYRIFCSQPYIRNNLLHFTIAFRDKEFKEVAVNGSLGVKIESAGVDVYSGFFNLGKKDFNVKETTLTKTSFDKGYQEIIEETHESIFYELRIPVDYLEKGVSEKGIVFAEFVFPNKESVSCSTEINELPRDPARFEGNPDVIDLRAVTVLRENEHYYYQCYLQATEKEIRVSAKGKLIISAENPEGKQIFSKTINVSPEDFSFEKFKSIYATRPSEQLVLGFGFSSEEIQGEECIAKILVFFEGKEKEFESETSRLADCSLNCSLKDLCEEDRLKRPFWTR